MRRYISCVALLKRKADHVASFFISIYRIIFLLFALVGKLLFDVFVLLHVVVGVVSVEDVRVMLFAFRAVSCPVSLLSTYEAAITVVFPR